MRKVFGYILAAAFLTLASCSKEQLAGEGTALQSGEPRIITLSFNPSTKTTPGGTDGRSPEFVPGDIIRLSNSTSWEERAVNVSDGVATVSTFLGGELKVVYPAAAAATDANGLITGIKVQASQSGRFRDANICMTTIPANANSATLLNQTAVLRFYVDASIGVKSVTVTSGGSNIANEGAHLKQITVDPAGNELISSVTDDPDRRLCYVAVLPGANTNALTFTSETTTQGTVVHKPLRTSVTLAANGMYNAFIPYYIKMKVNDSPETYQKWGYCNVGAFLPEEAGRYFAWGETTGQVPNGTTFNPGFSWSNCPHTNGTYSDSNKAVFTRYTASNNAYAKSGTADGKTVLDLADDAAHVNWGDDWRMPTGGEGGEFGVLINGNDKGWITYYGVKGRKFADIDNESNYVFFPAAGLGNGATYSQAGDGVRYWASTLATTSNPSQAFGLGCGGTAYDINPVNEPYNRCLGRTIRPIYIQDVGSGFDTYTDEGNI